MLVTFAVVVFLERGSERADVSVLSVICVYACFFCVCACECQRVLSVTVSKSIICDFARVAV